MAARNIIDLAGLALNFQSDGVSDGVPDWIQLTPAGPDIVGRDGRRWIVPDLARVIDAFNAGGKAIQIDIEHATQLKAPKGEPAPAVGWIEEMEDRDGALWGRADWNEAGRNAVQTRAYRYLSPAFTFDRATGEIRRMVSVGLTNNPNLDLAALNTAEEGDPEQMDKAVLEALGLNSTATAADAVIAIGKLKSDRDTALNSAQAPDPAKFAPIADLQAAQARITSFEAADKARGEVAINAAVDAAVAAGKIAPASRDFYVAVCSDQGVDAFTAAMQTAPTIVNVQKVVPAAVTPAGQLTAEEQAICSQLGIVPAEFLAAKAEEKSA